MLSVSRKKLFQILLTTVTTVSLLACVSNINEGSDHSTKPQETSTETKSEQEENIETFLKNNEAIISTISQKTPNTIMQCIENEMIHKFRLPAQFYQIDDHDNIGKYIWLINPMTHQKGIMILIRPTENMSKIDLFDNGIKTISAAWRQIPEKCK